MIYKVTSFLAAGKHRDSVMSEFDKQSYFIYSSFSIPRVNHVSGSCQDIEIGWTIPDSVKLENDKFVYQIMIDLESLSPDSTKLSITKRINYDIILRSLKNGGPNLKTNACCMLRYVASDNNDPNIEKIDSTILLPSGVFGGRVEPNVSVLGG